MVAVFTKTHAQFKELRLDPKKYIGVTRIDDIRGRRFTGLDVKGNAFENIGTRNAFDALMKSQPELFINE